MDPITAFITQVVISLVLSVVAYVLTPKPKQPKPDAARDMDNPTAEAGRPIPVVFGTVIVKGLNVLWYGDKSTKTYEVKA